MEQENYTKIKQSESGENDISGGENTLLVKPTESQLIPPAAITAAALHSPPEDPIPLHHQATTGVPEYQLAHRDWVGPQGSLESIIRAQRRIKGVIVSVEPGACRIASEYGEFPFNLSTVKPNKRYPDRKPQAHDRCEFKVSDASPPKATSIRIAIPKVKEALTVGPSCVGSEGTEGSCSMGPSSVGSFEPSSLSGISGHTTGLDDICYGLQYQWDHQGGLKGSD